MQEVFRLVARVGPTDKPILIQGESGTGKELLPAALYESSQLSDKPFVTINYAALPETLLESELFGHERGSFTGAIGSKQGLFEVAERWHTVHRRDRRARPRSAGKAATRS